MSNQIRADYQELTEIANKFTQQAASIEDMLGDLKAKFADLENGGWIGEGAQAFFEEMNEVVLRSTSNLQRSLTQAAQVTIEIRDLVQQADDRASSPFKRT